MICATGRAGMPWDGWEVRIADRNRQLGAVTLGYMLMRKPAECHWMLSTLDKSDVRMCATCRCHGAQGTCGVEVEGLDACGERWWISRKYPANHKCHLGLPK